MNWTTICAHCAIITLATRPRSKPRWRLLRIRARQGNKYAPRPRLFGAGLVVRPGLRGRAHAGAETGPGHRAACPVARADRKPAKRNRQPRIVAARRRERPEGVRIGYFLYQPPSGGTGFSSGAGGAGTRAHRCANRGAKKGPRPAAV